MPIFACVAWAQNTCTTGISYGHPPYPACYEKLTGQDFTYSKYEEHAP